jgi:CheY-like chemotaxis protein
MYSKPESTKPGPPVSTTPLSRRSLVLEDNVLVGMQIEGLLLDLGAEVVDIAKTVARAIELIASHVYEFVLLDVNLGNETSRRVAEALQARGIPYAFSTGYGEIPWATIGVKHVPVLTKPINGGTLAGAVELARKVVCPRSV